MTHVLIVEDEHLIARLIEMSLTRAGYDCTVAGDGRTAADLIEENDYDLALLDIMLPGLDGYELLEYLRPQGVPVIFITAKGTVKERVEGLRRGADDYIVKPFVVEELLARVESVLRRYHKAERFLHVLDITIDTESRTVLKGQTPIDLTIKEFDLLLLFVQNKNIALVRDTIYERVWESPYLGDTRTVDLHVQRLRKKLGWENHLQTVYKVGYRLVV